MLLFTGVRNLTMDAIAADLGISKRTLYELFSDKEDLIIRTFEHIMLKNNKKLLDIIEKTSHVIEALFVIIEQQYQQVHGFNPILLEDMNKYFTLLKARFYGNCNDIRRLSVSYVLLEKGIEQSIFRSDLKIDIVDNFLQELVRVFHQSEGLRLMKFSKKEALDNILLPYFRGICTQKGQELMERFFKDVV